MNEGDIVKIFSPMVGYDKYHICMCAPIENKSGLFLFLNSDPNYNDVLAIDCDRIPIIPKSSTGVTAISFSLLVRYNSEKLKKFDARILGKMPIDVLVEMSKFIDTVNSLPQKDKKAVRDALIFLTG